jgi:osmotically inducible protein OsmC
MKRSARAVWSGGLREGSGVISMASGALSQTPYALACLSDETKGTSSGELLAAAHASCVTMTLAGLLAGAGMTPERIETRAEVTLDKTDRGWMFTGVRLLIKARIPGAEREKFLAMAETARKGCPVSRALNVPISLEAELEG